MVAAEQVDHGLGGARGVRHLAAVDGADAGTVGQRRRVGEPEARRPRSVRVLLLEYGFGGNGRTWSWSYGAEALSVAGDGPFGRLAEVVPQVPAVRTWTACGAPAVTPSAKNGARSRQTISTPGRSASQAAKLDVSRSGSRSTGRRVSASTSAVP
ncbi:hypothetical protein Kpho01_75100 [Kitasatospora phosalacinea]|uniref:Uncharacterized protein n=1 Tax=Kitasatospora phosalacinea TaxID=2065 RepID=A0A9W6PQK1_9ACTN|nr:hypothetical protein Kpho01_75100 [Kitasatospora phosalacinea]